MKITQVDGDARKIDQKNREAVIRPRAHFCTMTQRTRQQPPHVENYLLEFKTTSNSKTVSSHVTSLFLNSQILMGSLQTYPLTVDCIQFIKRFGKTAFFKPLAGLSASLTLASPVLIDEMLADVHSCTWENPILRLTRITSKQTSRPNISTRQYYWVKIYFVEPQCGRNIFVQALSFG